MYCDLQNINRCYSCREAAICVKESVGNVEISFRLGDVGADARMNRLYDDIRTVESIFLEDVDIHLDLDIAGVCSGGIADDAIHEIPQVNSADQSRWPGRHVLE